MPVSVPTSPSEARAWTADPWVLLDLVRICEGQLHHFMTMSGSIMQPYPGEGIDDNPDQRQRRLFRCIEMMCRLGALRKTLYFLQTAEGAAPRPDPEEPKLPPDAGLTPEEFEAQCQANFAALDQAWREGKFIGLQDKPWNHPIPDYKPNNKSTAPPQVLNSIEPCGIAAPGCDSPELPLDLSLDLTVVPASIADPQTDVTTEPCKGEICQPRVQRSETLGNLAFISSSPESGGRTNLGLLEPCSSLLSGSHAAGSPASPQPLDLNSSTLAHSQTIPNRTSEISNLKSAISNYLPKSNPPILPIQPPRRTRLNPSSPLCAFPNLASLREASVLSLPLFTIRRCTIRNIPLLRGNLDTYMARTKTIVDTLTNPDRNPPHPCFKYASTPPPRKLNRPRRDLHATPTPTPKKKLHLPHPQTLKTPPPPHPHKNPLSPIRLLRASVPPW